MREWLLCPMPLLPWCKEGMHKNRWTGTGTCTNHWPSWYGTIPVDYLSHIKTSPPNMATVSDPNWAKMHGSGWTIPFWSGSGLFRTVWVRIIFHSRIVVVQHQYGMAQTGQFGSVRQTLGVYLLSFFSHSSPPIYCSCYISLFFPLSNQRTMSLMCSMLVMLFLVVSMWRYEKIPIFLMPS